MGEKGEKGERKEGGGKEEKNGSKVVEKAATETKSSFAKPK